MPVETTSHPPKDQLIAFGQGKLAAEESTQVEQHLEVCHECCETLLDLKDDTFVGLVRAAKPQSPANQACVEPRATNITSCDSGQIATLLHSSETKIGSSELPIELRNHPRYRMVEWIGHGGMGSVYRAEHRLMNRMVAIKLINPELIRHPEAVERFHREVRAAAKLSHPNIVAAYDAEQAGNSHFLVMEFVEGTDLAGIVERHGPLPIADACECVRQAAAGLQHAHEQGMVHRDIKPHNLIRAAGGRVRILDFGLAGFVSETANQGNHRTEMETSTDEGSGGGKPAHLTTLGSVMGTPDYMAPEQAVDAHSADIRADIYSLGCTLHFLLTGQPPFEADNVIGKLNAHANEPPPSLRTLRQDVPAELSQVVAQMLAKNPAERFPTPADLASALEPFTKSSASPPKGRVRTLVAAALVGLIGLLAGVIYVLTDKGEFIIEPADDQVAIMVNQSGVKIRDAVSGREYSLKPGAHPLYSGAYEIDVSELPSGLEFSTSKFTLSRGKEVRVKVRLKSKTDLELLQGPWEPVAAEVMGVAVPAAFIQTVAPTLTFDGDKIIAQTAPTSPLANLNMTGLVRLDPTKTPKTVDIVYLGENARTMLGVYRLKDDLLTLCVYVNPDRSEARPTEFVSRPTQATELPFSFSDLVTPELLKKATNMVGLVTLKRAAATAVSSENPRDTSVPAANRVRENLLTDPSFENTSLTQLPRDWRAWLNDGPEFRCAVVAGGHTGQRCLQISGKGTRGVVFGNDIKVDRSKRYALKGWAKFEGNKDARAIIKFNYFRGSEFLGVHDLVGVTADQPGWHLLEKTDSLDVYPQADHFYAMCHVEGSGTGWFDDLELVAYDRDTLPVGFDSRHGRHNRLTGANSLDRWVGTWDTEYDFRESDNSPKETKLTMTTASERTLGDYFLISHAKAAPVAPQDRTPMAADPPANVAALSGEERLLFLTFDQNLGAFRQWCFSSNGKAFEWRGPWDDATKSLELRMLPDASNLFSSEQFVDADHVEAKLRFQYVMGTRDAGRWTATRKAATAKVDVPTVKAPANEPTELALLNKHAGEWTIRATYNPSVWNPQRREETITEKSHWILDGRFLMTRAFNEKGELTSIWIATYEPLEKSNHTWFFNANGSSGQWRVTWDASSRVFHWLAIDMPTGWIGTGFNRWINDDTFDNQALIKDENGRVLLDGTQDKRRKRIRNE